LILTMFFGAFSGVGEGVTVGEEVLDGDGVAVGEGKVGVRTVSSVAVLTTVMAVNVEAGRAELGIGVICSVGGLGLVAIDGAVQPASIAINNTESKIRDQANIVNLLSSLDF